MRSHLAESRLIDVSVIKPKLIFATSFQNDESCFRILDLLSFTQRSYNSLSVALEEAHRDGMSVTSMAVVRHYYQLDLTCGLLNNN